MAYTMTFNGEPATECGGFETIEAADEWLAEVEDDAAEYTFVEIIDEAGEVVARRTIG